LNAPNSILLIKHASKRICSRKKKVPNSRCNACLLDRWQSLSTRWPPLRACQTLKLASTFSRTVLYVESLTAWVASCKYTEKQRGNKRNHNLALLYLCVRTRWRTQGVLTQLQLLGVPWKNKPLGTKTVLSVSHHSYVLFSKNQCVWTMRTNVWDKLKESKHVHFRVGKVRNYFPPPLFKYSYSI
jgi:hypothetical protein